MINGQHLIFLIVTIITILPIDSNGFAFDPRILETKNVTENSAPFIVSLQYNDEHYCAGAIIGEHWVITAGHCLADKDKVLSLTLVAGNINLDDATSTTQNRSIDNYVINDLYLGGASPYDIGLVYTSTPFKWTNTVAPIKLPEINSTATGDALLYGWDRISTINSSDYNTAFQMTTVKIITLSSCKSGLANYGSKVHETNLCTERGDNDACVTDSGGPLVQNVNGQHVLIGILSWGQKQCGQSYFPSVYVKVSSFITWIIKSQITILKQVGIVLEK